MYICFFKICNFFCKVLVLWYKTHIHHTQDKNVYWITKKKTLMLSLTVLNKIKGKQFITYDCSYMYIYALFLSYHWDYWKNKQQDIRLHNQLTLNL